MTEVVAVDGIDAPSRRRTAPLVAAAVVFFVLGAVTATALLRSPSSAPGEPGGPPQLAGTPSIVAPAPVEPDLSAPPGPSSDTPPQDTGTENEEPDVPCDAAACSPAPRLTEDQVLSVAPASQAGSIESATIAVREACRRFYGYDLDKDLNSVPAAEPELHQRCDLAPIDWVGDCYDPTRPSQFTPGSGGCAQLGGYLAVIHGPPTGGDPLYRFSVGDDSWTIRPESD